MMPRSRRNRIHRSTSDGPVSLRPRNSFGFFRCADRERGRCRRALSFGPTWTASYTANPHGPQKQNCFMNFLTIRHSTCRSRRESFARQVLPLAAETEIVVWVSQHRSSRSCAAPASPNPSLKFSLTEAGAAIIFSIPRGERESRWQIAGV